MEIIEQHIQQLYKLLNHAGLWSQLHCHNTQNNQVISRRLVNNEKEIIEWAKENNEKGNCFIGRCARDKNGGCSSCSTLTLDIDPIRGPVLASTDDQHRESIMAARLVVRAMQFGDIASSGNGALVLFPLREGVTKELAESWGQLIESKARQIIKENGLDERIRVDSTWDGARLIKLLGTTSTKGSQDQWRQARFIDTPIQNPARQLQFIQWLNDCARASTVPISQALPEVSKGELDRSKADYAIACGLKARGFTAQECYTALCEVSTRPEREDDAKRIVNKLYYMADTNRKDMQGHVGSIQLWTPENGLSEYESRQRPGTPELPTGFVSIDSATFGLSRGHIFTVAARTNVGKTTFAINVARHLCGLRKRILFMSTELTRDEIWDRYFAVSTGIPAFKLQHGLDSGEDKESIRRFKEEFKQHQLFIYDGSRPNIGLIQAAVEQSKPDVLVFDYFQHVENRETKELEEFVMQIKELAKSSQIAVLMAAQLHDGFPNPKTGKVGQPSMRDVKGCKMLNDESKVVLLLDWDRDAVSGESAAVVKVLMAKNKGKRTDSILKLDRAIPRFLEE